MEQYQILHKAHRLVHGAKALSFYPNKALEIEILLIEPIKVKQDSEYNFPKSYLKKI
jgi:hypothetical protein